MQKTAIGLSLAALAVVSPGFANADIIVFSDTFGPAAAFSPTIMVTLGKFDPLLGELTSVTLTLDSNTSTGSIAWDNEALVPSDVTLGIGFKVTATAPLALAATAIPLQTGSGSVEADSDGAADFIGTDAFSVIGGSGSDSSSITSSAAGVLTFYTATFMGETFDIGIDSVLETFLSTTGGFGPIDPAFGVFDGTVTITYEFIPAPGAVLLAMIGLPLVGWVKRRLA